MRASDDPAARARALLAVMTTDEKIAMLHGYASPEYTGLTQGNARLGIPALNMNDGRQGFRPNDGNNKQTAFPCQLNIVATFDKELYRAFGEAMGEEFAGKGGNVMLAPMLILARVPQSGRIFESVRRGGAAAATQRLLFYSARPFFSPRRLARTLRSRTTLPLR